MVDSRTRPRVCRFCNKIWQAENGGKGKRKGSACDECYPYVRKAEVLWHAAKHRAKKLNLDFSITKEFVIKALYKGCQRTSKPFVLSYAGNHYGNRLPYSPSLDRIRADEGYTEKNTQVVSWLYNLTKARFTDEEVLEFCQAVVTTNRAKNAAHPMLDLSILKQAGPSVLVAE